MGRIQEYRRSFKQNTASFRDIQQAGTTFGQAAQLARQVGQAATRIRDVEAKSYANKKALELEEKFAGFVKEAGEETKNKPSEYKQTLENKLNTYKQDFNTDAVNQYGKKLVDDMFNEASSKYLRAADKEQTKQVIRFTNATAKENIEKLADKQYDEQFTTLDDRLQNVKSLARPVYDANDKLVGDATVKSGSNRMVVNAFTSALDNGDFATAEEMLKSKKYNDYLEGDDKSRIMRRIVQGKKSRVAKMESLDKYRLNNPYKYAEKLGEDVPQVDFFSGPEELAISLEKRESWRQEKEAAWATKINLLSDLDAKQFEVLSGENTSEKMDFISRLKTGVPENLHTQISKELFVKKPEMAVAYSLIDDEPNTARSILEGKALEETNTYKVPNNDLLETYNTKIANVVRNPDAREKIFQAFKYDYINNAHSQGLDPKTIDADSVDKSLERIIGPQIEFNDSPTLSFKKKDGNYATEDEIETQLERATIDDLETPAGKRPMDVQKRPLEMDTFLNYGKLQPIGGGEYHMVVTRNGIEEVILDQDGNRFVLDMEELMDKDLKPFRAVPIGRENAQ